jgi:copper chaperone
MIKGIRSIPQVHTINVEKDDPMKPHELTIQGMSCAHCVMHVRQALDTVDGLEVEDVQVGKARVWYEDEKVPKALTDKVEEAGYKVVSIQ